MNFGDALSSPIIINRVSFPNTYVSFFWVFLTFIRQLTETTGKVEVYDIQQRSSAAVDPGPCGYVLHRLLQFPEYFGFEFKKAMQN